MYEPIGVILKEIPLNKGFVTLVDDDDYKWLTQSVYKGVAWNKNARVWHSSITLGGKTTYIGQFQDEVAAARAYDEVATQHYGAFALLNFRGG